MKGKWKKKKRKKSKKRPTNISLLLELLVISQPTSRVQNLKDNITLKNMRGRNEWELKKSSKTERVCCVLRYQGWTGNFWIESSSPPFMTWLVTGSRACTSYVGEFISRND